MLEMVGAGLISSGILLFLIGALGAMTWGRITDKFGMLDKLIEELRGALEDIFNRLRSCETDLAVLKDKKEAKK